jgi:hypothetical protein
MASSIKCPECGAVILYDAPEEVICGCGWSESGQFEKDIQRQCESQGFSYRHLLRDLGDVETVDGFLWALSKDD